MWAVGCASACSGAEQLPCSQRSLQCTSTRAPSPSRHQCLAWRRGSREHRRRRSRARATPRPPTLHLAAAGAWRRLEAQKEKWGLRSVRSAGTDSQAACLRWRCTAWSVPLKSGRAPSLCTLCPTLLACQLNSFLRSEAPPGPCAAASKQTYAVFGGQGTSHTGPRAPDQEGTGPTSQMCQAPANMRVARLQALQDPYRDSKRRTTRVTGLRAAKRQRSMSVASRGDARCRGQVRRPTVTVAGDLKCKSLRLRAFKPNMRATVEVARSTHSTTAEAKLAAGT